MLHAVARGLDPGQVRPAAGGDADLRPKGRQPGGQGPAQPPIADDQRPGPVQRDGQFLQGDLNGSLRSRYRIGYRQLFPGKIVVQRHPPGGSQFRCRRAYPSGADDLPRTQAVQHLGQLYPFA